VADFPDDFRLSYYFAETLGGIDDRKALDLYKNCIRLYTADEKNKRYSAEYEKARSVLNGNARKDSEKG